MLFWNLGGGAGSGGSEQMAAGTGAMWEASDVAERRRKLAQMEKEEAEKELARLVRKVGHARAVRLLELAVSVKPKSAIEALEKMEPAGQKQAS